MTTTSNETEKQEQNGYCPTCKKPMDRIELCDTCVGRRDGKPQNSGIGPPPKVEQKPWKD